MTIKNVIGSLLRNLAQWVDPEEEDREIHSEYDLENMSLSQLRELCERADVQYLKKDTRTSLIEKLCDGAGVD